ncbi:MAG: TlpA disulfide reductase family protein [Ferruginibacter sp.]
MKKKIVLILFTVLSRVVTDAQNLVITGNLYPPKVPSQTLLISEQIRNPIDNSFSHIYEYIPGKNLSFNAKIYLPSPALYWLNYGGKAKKVFLSPNDSINIVYIKTNNVDTIITADGFETSNTRLILSGNNVQQFTFFDSLENKTGNFVGKRYNVDFTSPGWENIYKDSIKLTYDNRMAYLEKYAGNYHLSNEFINTARIEIKATYLSALIAAVYHEEKTKFPTGYFDEIDKENFTWDKYKISNSYATAVYTYVTHYLNWENIGIGTKEQSLSSIYDGIVTNLKNDSVRNFHLTYLMSTTLDKHPDNYEEYLDKYKQDCSNKTYVAGIEQAYDAYMARYNNAAFSAQLLAKTLFKSVDGKLITLKELLAKHKPLLIDFWASWCGPCLMEMPLSENFETSYKDKIDFAYVSIDASEEAWHKALSKNNLPGNHYLLLNERKSDFAKFIKLNYVPRFVLINSVGKIIVFNGAQPTNTAAFEKMLNTNFK